LEQQEKQEDLLDPQDIREQLDLQAQQVQTVRLEDLLDPPALKGQ
jgi:hypothetical protein